MNRKMIIITDPYVVQQNIYVYEDNNKIDIIPSTLEDLPNNIFAISSKYEIEDVSLLGPKQYNRGLLKTIQKEENNSQYKMKKLNFNLM